MKSLKQLHYKYVRKFNKIQNEFNMNEEKSDEWKHKNNWDAESQNMFLVQMECISDFIRDLETMIKVEDKK